MGWFDAVATRYGLTIQGATEVALTNLDVLGYLDEIPVCVAYKLADGTITENFPVTARLDGAQPVLEKLPGWKSDLSTVRSYDELPPAAQKYVEFIQAAGKVNISYISTGPHRNQLLAR